MVIFNKIGLLSVTVLSLLLISSRVLAADSGDKGNDNEEYSGVYENYQLIPNRMAELCKVSAEEIVQDQNKLVDCINSLAIKRRSSDAETSREGLKELKEIQAEQILKTMGLATAKAASIAEYISKTSEAVAEGNKNAKTTNDVDSAAIQTNAVLTSVADSLRQLYVEQLKLLAITNIENIDKATLENIASAETLKAGQENDAGEMGSGTTNTGSSADKGGSNVAVSNTVVVTGTEEILGDTLIYRGEGICELCIVNNGETTNCRQSPCSDGRYTDTKDKNVFWQCENGVCEKIDITEAGL